MVAPHFGPFYNFIFGDRNEASKACFGVRGRGCQIKDHQDASFHPVAANHPAPSGYHFSCHFTGRYRNMTDSSVAVALAAPSLSCLFVFDVVLVFVARI